jgi:hypothetical protein
MKDLLEMIDDGDHAENPLNHHAIIIRSGCALTTCVLVVLISLGKDMRSATARSASACFLTFISALLQVQFRKLRYT